MSSLPCVGLIAVLGLAFCPAAAAQKSGAVVAAPAVHAGIGMVHAHHFPANSNWESRPVAPRKSNIAGTTNNLSDSTSSSNPKVMDISADSGISLEEFTGLGPPINLNNYGQPGGVNGNLGVEALINPVTQAELALASRLRGNVVGSSAYLLGGGYAYYPGDYEQAQPEPQPAEAPATPQPQIIIIQQPVPAGAPSAEPARAEEIAPQQEPTSPLTLVLKNGSHIEAVAFTRQGDKIVYITRTGARSTVAIADVDAAATTKLNDDRGTPLTLSL